jgi:hypothetical protein
MRRSVPGRGLAGLRPGSLAAVGMGNGGSGYLRRPAEEPSWRRPAEEASWQNAAEEAPGDARWRSPPGGAWNRDLLVAGGISLCWLCFFFLRVAGEPNFSILAPTHTSVLARGILANTAIAYLFQCIALRRHFHSGLVRLRRQYLCLKTFADTF